jgi:hypothetical protein
MNVNLPDCEERIREAIREFWRGRASAKQKQMNSGKLDQGERASVTAGKNLDGFVTLLREIICANGLTDGDVHQKRAVLTLPGYFRPTKLWDLLVIHNGELVAAIELKSQVGPSFGNNFNNRTEEAIGNALDFWTAYREGAFGKQLRPFLAWLMLVEDAKGSNSPVNDKSPHFPVFEEFKSASYLQRYDLLCQKLVQEQLYSTATIIASPNDAIKTGKYSSLSQMSSIRTFLISFAAHIAATALRSK